MSLAGLTDASCDSYARVSSHPLMRICASSVLPSPFGRWHLDLGIRWVAPCIHGYGLSECQCDGPREVGRRSCQCATAAQVKHTGAAVPNHTLRSASTHLDQTPGYGTHTRVLDLKATQTTLVCKLPASQQLAGTATPALDQSRAHVLPSQIVVCHVLGSENQLHPTGIHQPALTLSTRTPLSATSEPRWPDPPRLHLHLRTTPVAAATASHHRPFSPQPAPASWPPSPPLSI